MYVTIKQNELSLLISTLVIYSSDDENQTDGDLNNFVTSLVELIIVCYCY